MTTTGMAATTDRVGQGIALAILAVIVFGIQDAISKVLVQTYHPFQIVMMRYWAFAAMSLFFATRRSSLRTALHSGRPMLQVLRGLLLMFDIWMFSIAVASVPLAELQAISLVYPLLVTLLAIPLLGERIGVFRLTAVIVGFVGAMIIVRPGGLPLNLGTISALGSACAYAIYLVLTRIVSKVDATPTSMVYVGLVGLVLSSAVGVFYWKPMDLASVGGIVGLMITMCVSHGAMMKALSLAPAGVLQPFNYLSLPWGITLSFVFFGHLIDPISLIGAVLITGAGIVVMARERRRLRTPTAQIEAMVPRD
jgi:drug/metabolite transporter (DMT)-like permease